MSDIHEPESKRCPVCGKKVFNRDLVFCSMKCSDTNRVTRSTAVMREVAVLLRQYRAGDWTPVD